MFARHTSVRMRPSGVAQSFRALVSKFNNQIPLGAKESNRLLTALTSSFRKELDKAHPTGPVRDDNKRPSPSSNKHHKTDRHDIHSSAGLADRHLASVLTNPLLAKAPSKPALDAVTAEAEMDNGANPLDVLESYQRQNHDTLDLAMACMRRLRLSMKHLPHEEQVAKVQEMQAGKRLLSWLWNGKHMNTQAYSDHEMLQDGLVWFVMMEGQEELLWQWLNSDLETPQSQYHKAYHKQQVDRRYIWKARILYAMVRTELMSPQGQAGTADAALRIYLRAVKNFHEENVDLMEKLILTNSARIALTNAFMRPPGLPNTNTFLYDQFISVHTNENLAVDIDFAYKAAMDEYKRAKLHLYHPAKPSGDPFYYSVMGTPRNDMGKHVAEYLLQEKTAAAKDGRLSSHHMHIFLRAAELLKMSGQPRKARDLVTMAEALYPEHLSWISAKWHRILIRNTGHHSNDNREKQRHPQYSRQRDPNWLSQYFPATT